MEQLDQIIKTISMTMGASWASGINLYATLLVLGIAQMTGNIILPPDLQILSNPLVIAAAGLMYAVEFFTDKIPGIDTGWDSIHTFIRIPAGALLAFGMTGEISQGAALAAAIVGGTLAAGSHATKAGTRVMINASPEPFTNWTASITEDILAVAGLWTAFNHPWIFACLLILFILFMIWFLPKIWKGIKSIFRFIGRLFGVSAPSNDGGLSPDQLPAKGTGQEPVGEPAGESGQSSPISTETDSTGNSIEQKLEKLNDLFNKGLITKEEYSKKKQEILDKL